MAAIILDYRQTWESHLKERARAGENESEKKGLCGFEHKTFTKTCKECEQQHDCIAHIEDLQND